MSMNASSINALATATQRRDQESYGASFPASSPASFSGNRESMDPNLVTFMAEAREASVPMKPSSASISQGYPSVGGDSSNLAYLSYLNQHQHFDSARAATMKMPYDPAAASIPAGSQAHAHPFAPFADHASLTAQPQSNSAAATSQSRRRKPNFAEKLHSVLSSRECRHAVSWLPSGRSFCIADHDEFVRTILPKYFREAKFNSFVRRLKRWGFTKVYTTGMGQAVFAHDHFHRDRPDLCGHMNGREKVPPCREGDRVAFANASAAPDFDQEQLRNATMQYQLLQQQASFQQQALLRRQASHQRAMLPSAAAARPGGRFPSNNSARSVDGFATAHPPGAVPENVDTRAVLAEANALVARSMSGAPASMTRGPMPRAPVPRPVNHPHRVGLEGPDTILRAKAQLNRLNEDIASCEEQLAILQRLRDLKEKRQKMGLPSSPNRDIPPSA